jgi:hypothetical protein
LQERRFIPKQVTTSGVTSTTVFGLQPGVKYNVSVAAASENGGRGPATSKLFWTEVGGENSSMCNPLLDFFALLLLEPDPIAPPTPVIVNPGAGKDGVIHIRFEPLTGNPNGPVSGYRVVVINETVPAAAFNPAILSDYASASEEGIDYWITAEIDADWFDNHDEFVVGDGSYYGKYFNHGPLDDGQDYLVTVGTVSTLNNITKGNLMNRTFGLLACN